MSILHQIYEEDLETLERAIPCLQEALMFTGAVTRPDIQEHLSMCKTILSNVRWNYGPPTEAEEVK